MVALHLPNKKINKHSQATRLDANFSVKNRTPIIDLQDNSIGFDTTKPAPANSAGLMNLRNRARLINADLKIKSNSASGNVITNTLT